MRLLFAMAVMFALPAAAQTIVVEDGRCRLATAHRPAPDVAYRPGVDVNGKAVVPADLNGGNAVRTPRRVTIPLQIPISELLAVRPPFLDQVEVDAGLVLVDVETGYLTYDGQRLDQPQFLLCEEDNGVVKVLNLPPPPVPRPAD